MKFSDVRIVGKEKIPAITSPVLSQNTRLLLEMTTISFLLEDVYPIEVLAAVKFFGKNCIEVVVEGSPFHVRKENITEISDVTRHQDWGAYYDANPLIMVEFTTSIRVFLTGQNILNSCGGILAAFFDIDTLGEGKTPVMLSDEQIMTRIILPRIYKEAVELPNTQYTGSQKLKRWSAHKVSDNPIASVDIPDQMGCIICAVNGMGAIDFIETNLTEPVLEEFVAADANRGAIVKKASIGKDYIVMCVRLTLIEFAEMMLCVGPEIVILDHDEISSVDAWSNSVFDGVDPLQRMYALPAAAKINVLLKVNMCSKDWFDDIDGKYSWSDAIMKPIMAAGKILFKDRKETQKNATEK